MRPAELNARTLIAYTIALMIVSAFPRRLRWIPAAPLAVALVLLRRRWRQ